MVYVSVNFWNEEIKEYNPPFNKFKEFLDSYDFLEFLKEFRNNYKSNCLWVGLEDFIVFIANKVFMDFQSFSKSNNLSEKEHHMFLYTDNIDFWDYYIRDRLNLWTSNISAYHFYEIDRLIGFNRVTGEYGMKWPIFVICIDVSGKKYNVGVALGEIGNPKSTRVTETVTNVEYYRGINRIYAEVPYIEELNSCVIYELKPNNEIPYEIKQEWITELIKQGADLSNINYTIISNR